MSTYNSNYLTSKGLVERIFSLFPGVPDARIAEKLGIVRQVVQGWRAGKSKPTIEQIGKIVEMTSAGWQWLMTGKSDNLRELVNIYVASLESQVIDEAAFEWAKGEVLSWVLDNKQAMTGGIAELNLIDRLEVANRLFFTATHETKLDVSGQMYGDLEMTAYVHGPIVLGLLCEAGYGDSYQIAREVASKVLRDCRELDLFYPRAIPAPNASLQRESKNLAVGGEWPVRGRAAADESNGTRVPDTDDFDDSIQPPEGLTAVPVIGNSMSPLVLDGQYVLIDKEREGFETDGGIVVAAIREPEADDERAETMTGTFVKRCYDGGNGIYYFTSINEYSPFSAWHDHCRVWPVIGVWFAGKGRPPKE